MGLASFPDSTPQLFIALWGVEPVNVATPYIHMCNDYSIYILFSSGEGLVVDIAPENRGMLVTTFEAGLTGLSGIENYLYPIPVQGFFMYTRNIMLQ